MVFRCLYCTFWISLLYPYSMTQCGVYFSTFLFIPATLTLINKLYKSIFIKYYLKNNITLFSSIAHGFFNILTAQMANNLNDNQSKKPKNTLLNLNLYIISRTLQQI